jgi:hypothetical protein
MKNTIRETTEVSPNYHKLAAIVGLSIIITAMSFASVLGAANELSPPQVNLQKKAAQGDAEAQFQLGKYYQKQAHDWHTRAAEQGHAGALVKLGDLYASGIGMGEEIEIDGEKAAQLYRTAAEQGDAEGQLRLAELYETGQGVEENRAEAIKWTKKAAQQGFVEAQLKLAEVYEQGLLGEEQDIREAKKWYKKAADQGEESAKQKLREIASGDLTPDREENAGNRGFSRPRFYRGQNLETDKEEGPAPLSMGKRKP